MGVHCSVPHNTQDTHVGRVALSNLAKVKTHCHKRPLENTSAATLCNCATLKITLLHLGMFCGENFHKNIAKLAHESHQRGGDYFSDFLRLLDFKQSCGFGFTCGLSISCREPPYSNNQARLPSNSTTSPHKVRAAAESSVLWPFLYGNWEFPAAQRGRPILKRDGT